MDSEKEFDDNISQCMSTDKIASNLVIAVITVCGSLGTGLNLLKIYEYYTDNKLDFFDLSYVPNSKKTKEKAFYNCLSITFYIDGSKISAKIFPNGSIQIPGCKNLGIINKSSELIREFIIVMSKRCGIDNIIKEPEKFMIRDLRMVIIISNFAFKYQVLQEKLKDIINKNRFEGIINDINVWRIASFQPEKYSGVNIKYLTEKCRNLNKDKYINKDKMPIKINGQISIFIFKSGKGTITGAKDSHELLEAYIAITSLVRKYSDQVFIKDSHETGNNSLSIA